MSKRRKDQREKDLTARYMADDIDEDRVEVQHRFSRRSSDAQQRKMEQTALLRAAEEQLTGDLESLPIGEVIQVYSLFSEVEHEGVTYLCVVRKTLSKLADTFMVVGDRVRFRDTGIRDEAGRPEAVVEQVLPRRTLLTRADSFKAVEVQPIVANADQMLIVASLHEPDVKWGLIDRMLVAAQAGGLRPTLCLNKIDMAIAPDGQTSPDVAFAREALAHYQRLGIATLETSVPSDTGLAELRGVLANRTTVLAGHSGVGKSSLIRSIQPALDLRIGAISAYTGKGRHTTSSARRYDLSFGGQVIDTPGVKLFGLWNVTRNNLEEFFPDIGNDSAPDWRRASYERIRESLG